MRKKIAQFVGRSKSGTASYVRMVDPSPVSVVANDKRAVDVRKQLEGTSVSEGGQALADFQVEPGMDVRSMRQTIFAAVQATEGTNLHSDMSMIGNTADGYSKFIKDPEQFLDALIENVEKDAGFVSPEERLEIVEFFKRFGE